MRYRRSFRRGRARVRRGRSRRRLRVPRVQRVGYRF